MHYQFTGIGRKTEFSPNHVESDSLILQHTAHHLQLLGADVNLLDESELTPESIRSDLVFSMVQGPTGTEILKTITQARDILVINSPDSVCNCYRIHLVKKLKEHGIPFPRSVIGSTEETAIDESIETHFPYSKIWVKRGDVHAVHDEDVSLTSNESERRMILNAFRRRGIRQVVFQEHLEGNTVKFYAVRGTAFFHWYYLHELYPIAFSVETLQELASLSAKILGLDIYGGDAVIQTDGAIKIIDINDWPSFAPVRDAAGREIARFIYNKAEEYNHERKT
ncbi:MAG: hypothetical protein ACM3SY_19710 [Candidatus Omnitrophota bacterium]